MRKSIFHSRNDKLNVLVGSIFQAKKRKMKRDSREEKSIGIVVFNNDKIRVKIPKKQRRSKSETPLASSSARGQQCNGSYDSMETGPGRYVKREQIEGVLSLYF